MVLLTSQFLCKVSFYTVCVSSMWNNPYNTHTADSMIDAFTVYTQVLWKSHVCVCVRSPVHGASCSRVYSRTIIAVWTVSDREMAGTCVNVRTPAVVRKWLYCAACQWTRSCILYLDDLLIIVDDTAAAVVVFLCSFVRSEEDMLMVVTEWLPLNEIMFCPIEGARWFHLW